MTVETNVTEVESADPASGEQPQQARPRFTRTQADALGRGAVQAATSVAGGAAKVASAAAGGVTTVCRAIQSVPPAVQLLGAAGVLMLLGLVGAIALTGPAALLCLVVLVPLCSAILGALGYRWYSGNFNAMPQAVPQAAPQAAPHSPEQAQPATPDLQRSIEYVDKKLTLALSSFGTEQHQQAVIALFQAKTAVELTLGTEDADAAIAGLGLETDQHIPRPRIRASSLAAS